MVHALGRFMESSQLLFFPMSFCWIWWTQALVCLFLCTRMTQRPVNTFSTLPFCI